MTDKGYDSKANRAACRKRGIVAVIPHRSNAKDRPAFFPKMLYRGRARIERKRCGADIWRFVIRV